MGQITEIVRADTYDSIGCSYRLLTLSSGYMSHVKSSDLKVTINDMMTTMTMNE